MKLAIFEVLGMRSRLMEFILNNIFVEKLEYLLQKYVAKMIFILVQLLGMCLLCKQLEPEELIYISS